VSRRPGWAALLVAALAGSRLRAASTVDISLHDAARNREVPLRVYSPTGAGPRPLIVFSHGYGGSREAYAYLGDAWAEAGYVVVLPTHLGSDRAAILAHGLSGAGDSHKAFAEQLERTADVAFIVASVAGIESRVPGLRGRIDALHVGVGGHSMGAGTALFMAGATAPNEGGRSFHQPYVKAVVTMSPQGAGEEGFESGSWDPIAIPVMTMSGTDDRGVNGEPPTWRLEPFQHMPPGDKYQVTVHGANHLTFAIGLRFHECIVQATTAFWDAYLKGDRDARSRLRTVGACEVDAK